MFYSVQKLSLVVLVAYSIAGWFALAKSKVNYGRFLSSISGVHVAPKTAWLLLGGPEWLLAFYFLAWRADGVSLAYGLFQLHYVHRDIIYPLSMKTSTPMPLEIMAYSFVCKFANGFLQGIANEQHTPVPGWQSTLGGLLFAVGMAVNIHADHILQRTKAKLARQGETAYARIDGFLFKWVANPNYLGEIVEWAGYALLSGHFYAWLSVFGTANVLIAGAVARNRWNKEHIKNYPLSRKAILPLIL